VRPIFWFHLAESCWLVFLSYCVLSALKRKAAKKKEPWRERLRHVVPVMIALCLLFMHELSYAWLGMRFVPEIPAIGVTGAALTAIGVALAIWARWHIGENWSAVVSIRAEHELVRTGPYRTMRHPIYGGVLLAMIGTALAVGEVRALVGVAIAWIAFYWKARKEEAWLRLEFGGGFEAHEKQTGMFLPRFFVKQRAVSRVADAHGPRSRGQA
jgi:protein-S-isoprenylcysteine O-methyltransferase Ste14